MKEIFSNSVKTVLEKDLLLYPTFKIMQPYQTVVLGYRLYWKKKRVTFKTNCDCVGVTMLVGAHSQSSLSLVSKKIFLRVTQNTTLQPTVL